MERRKIIGETLRRKELEVQALEERLRTARIYMQALRDVVALLDKDDEPGGAAGVKAGSAVAEARAAILARGGPMHIAAILEAMGKPVDRETRGSLASSLAAYVRRGEIFTRPAPNTFGLRELERPGE